MNTSRDENPVFQQAGARCAVLLVALILTGVPAASLGLTWRALKAEWRALDALDGEIARRRFVETELAFTRETLDDMYTELRGRHMANADGLTDLQRRFLENALIHYERLTTGPPGAALDVRRDAAAAIHRIGQIHAALGRPGRADEAFERAVVIRRELAENPGARPADRLALAEGLRARGAALNALGFDFAAEGLDREAVDLADALVENHPGAACYLGALIESLSDLSQCQENQVRHVEAETAHRRALKFARSLAGSHSSLPKYRSLLARLLGREGVRAAARGDRDGAEVALRQAVEILRDLHADDPDRIDAQARFAAAMGDLAVVLIRADRPNDAEPELRRSITLNDDLAEHHPDVLLYRRRSASGWHNLGVLNERLGRAAASKAAWRQSIELYEGILRDFPDHHEFRADLAGTNALLASKERRARRPAEALEFRVSETAAARSLVDLAPADAARRLLLATIWIDIGYTLQAFDRGDEAVNHFRNGLAAFDVLLEQDPAAERHRSFLAYGLNRLAQCLKFRREGFKEAEALLRRAVKIRRDLADERPDDIDAQRFLGDDLCQLSELRRLQGDPAEAVELCEEAVALQQSALAHSPTDPNCRQFVRNAYVELARAKRALGDRAGAAEAAERLARDLPDDALAQALAARFLEDRASAKSAVERAAKLDPRGHVVHHALAYLLATTSDPGLRDPSRAVEMARKATATASQMGEYESVLGVALFRAGDLDEAVAAIERAEKLPRRMDDLDSLVLALVQARKGDWPAARHHYDRALKWTETHSPADQELFECLRAEAEAALAREKL